jgi:hypothetical protein
VLPRNDGWANALKACAKKPKQACCMPQDARKDMQKIRRDNPRECAVSAPLGV